MGFSGPFPFKLKGPSPNGGSCVVVTAGFAGCGVHEAPNIEAPGAAVGAADGKKDTGAETAFASAGVRGVGATGARPPNTEVVGLVGSPKTLVVGGDGVMNDGVSGVASLRFPTRLNGAGEAGVGEGDRAGFKIGVVGVGGLGELRVESRGGVFGLVGLILGSLGSSSSSSLRGTSIGFAIMGSGWATGTAVLSVSSSSSGSKETGALAKGELRVGRVLGRPSPKGGGEGLVVGTGVDEDLNGGDGSLTGVPGGVVLRSLPAEDSVDTEDSEGEGEGVTRILGISNCGVVDGERDCGKGMLAGSGGDERWSSSDSSPSSGTSDRSLLEVYDCPDSSS